MLICSVLTFIFARSNDHGKREYWEGQTTNKLDGISDRRGEVIAWPRYTRASCVLADWTAHLAANPVTVIYKLATPYTIQLTPDLPVVRTGIKTLSVSANITPTFSATVKAMD